jgi:hypothetical protein
MRDFDELVRSLADRDRVDMIRALVAADAGAQRVARAGQRARRDSPAGYRREEALSQVARFGRIIHFLRFRSPAQGSTAGDLALCALLQEKLEAKGQWVGEHSG